MCLMIMGLGSLGFYLFFKFKDDEDISDFAGTCLVGGVILFVIAIVWLFSATGIYPIEFRK